MKDFEQLIGAWQSFEPLRKEFVRSELQYYYGNSEYMRHLREQIIDAMTLWEFIRTHLDLRQVSWETRRKFLEEFINHPIPHVRAIAMLESMPTSMFRRILWKYNIDFMFADEDINKGHFVVFESFLRRLESEQMRVIKDNYNDLFVMNEIPRAFSWKILVNSWRARFGRSRKEEFVNQLLKEESNGPWFDKRYERKGSWSYNLLNLAFGFNRYPNGVFNDVRVIEISPLNFLSVKNHANDFVVNQEAGGIYWWLYKIARSNYAWHPNREVYLKTHICPGFWYTLFIHALFWIVSPIAAIGLLSIIATAGIPPIFSWEMLGFIGMLIPGIVTPFWIVAAILRFMTRLTLPEKRREAITKWANEHDEDIGAAIVFFVILVAAAVIAAIILRVTVQVFGWFGWIVGILMAVTIYLYLGYKVHLKEEHEKTNFMNFPKWLRITLVIAIVFILAYCIGAEWEIFLNSMRIFIGWIVSIALGIWGFLSFIAIKLWAGILELLEVFWFAKWFLIFLVIPFVLLTIFVNLHLIIGKDRTERLGEQLEKLSFIMMWITNVLLVVALGMFLYMAYQTMGEAGLSNYWVIGIVGGATVAYLLFVREMSYYIEPQTREVRYLVKKDMRSEIDHRMLYQNRWFKESGSYAKRRIVRRIIDLIGRVVPYACDKYERATFYRMLVPVLTEELLDRLEREVELTEFRDLHYDERRAVFKNMIYGLGYEAAYREMIAEQTATEKVWKNFKRIIKKILKVVFFPLVLLWWILKLIFMVIEKLLEWGYTIVKLWRYFNKMCPYVVQPTSLRVKRE